MTPGATSHAPTSDSGCGIRQRLEDDAVDDAEDQRVGADGGADRDDGGQGKGGALEEAAKASVSLWVRRRRVNSEGSGRRFDSRRFAAKLTRCMQAFFDSVVALIIKTSTDLPPDVRAAMKHAVETEEDGVARRAGAQHHRPEHRSGRRDRRRDLPGHRHADLRGQDAGRRQPDLDEEADQGGDRRGHQARQAASEFRRFADRREQRQQPRPRHAGDPLRAVGARRHRGEADAQGRRLREHERAVLAAGGARAPRPRRSHDRRRAQVHPARGVERARQGLRARRDRRVHRRRSHAAATSKRSSSCSAASTTSIPIRGSPSSKPRSCAPSNTLGVGPMGFGGTHLADRLQGRRAEPPAGELLRVGRLRLLGVSPSRRDARRHRPARSRSGCIAIRRCRRSR